MRSAAVGCEVRGTSFLEVVHALADCGVVVVVVVGGGGGVRGCSAKEELSSWRMRARAHVYDQFPVIVNMNSGETRHFRQADFIVLRTVINQILAVFLVTAIQRKLSDLNGAVTGVWVCLGSVNVWNDGNRWKPSYANKCDYWEIKYLVNHRPQLWLSLRSP